MYRVICEPHGTDAVDVTCLRCGQRARVAGSGSAVERLASFLETHLHALVPLPAPRPPTG